MNQELIRAGQFLADCAFNLSQSKKLDENERRSLKESQEAWDKAVKERQSLMIYDWAYNDPKTGHQVYARTVEKAERLAKQGIKLLPVYAIYDENCTI